LQGSSFAKALLEEGGWKIRGVTRDPTKAESLNLVKRGIEVVKGDVNDVNSLKAAFKDAQVIFGNTAFSEALSNPTDADRAKLRPGQTLRQWCYQLEVDQGKNIADAVAANVDTLDLFIWSSLSSATKWSNGKYSGVFHFDSKAHVVDYINENYSEVSKKMSTIQLGLFITNWKWGPAAVPWVKVSRNCCPTDFANCH
jgi:NmrA-like family